MNIADILVHIHPDLSAEDRSRIEETVSANNGVMSVHFSAEQIHEMTVSYDPDAINSQTILEQVREWDKDAMMAGL